MRRSLLPHPATPCDALDAFDVEIGDDVTGGLRLRYTLLGATAALRIPPPRPPAAVDGLWAHTCCEAFVGACGKTAYREFNFSPSGEWAIYDFAGYRERMASRADLPAPAITVRRDAQALVLEVHLAAATLPAADALQLGLSAVVESADGALSYWALRHTDVRPDFHHRDAFALTLPRQP